MKFGETLIEEGIITKEQLSQALERQVIFGGRLGTNLVELGVVKEDHLTRLLSKHMKLTPVDTTLLDAAPKDAIDAIPSEMALEHKIIPFKKDKKRLHVAMIDAISIALLDELRFKTGFDIIPHIVSEIRLMYALEKHYGIKRDLRFISIIDNMQEEAAINEVMDKPSPPAKVEKEPQAVTAKTTAPSEPAAEMSDTASDLAIIKKTFTAVSDKEEIADIIIGEGINIAARSIIFIVKGQKLEGWKAAGIPLNEFVADLDPTSLFAQVVEKKNFYRGPMLNTSGNQTLISLLKGTPKDCVFIPIAIRERVVAIIYADNGNDNVLSANINVLNGLAVLASLSFEILILKKRIMDTNIGVG